MQTDIFRFNGRLSGADGPVDGRPWERGGKILFRPARAREDQWQISGRTCHQRLISDGTGWTAKWQNPIQEAAFWHSP